MLYFLIAELLVVLTVTILNYKYIKKNNFLLLCAANILTFIMVFKLLDLYLLFTDDVLLKDRLNVDNVLLYFTISFLINYIIYLILKKKENIKNTDNSFFVFWLILNVSVFAGFSIYFNNIIILKICTVAFLLNMIFAFSFVGESISRFTTGAKKIKTKEERELIEPLFNEVYEKARDFEQNISKNIKIYIEESENINAFALGRSTVCITRGAMQLLTKEEIKGILAHELGHHANGDTMTLVLLNLGSGIFSIFIMAINIIQKCLDFIIWRVQESRLAVKFVQFIKWCVNLLVKLLEIIVLAFQRKNEFKADMFAKNIGYGKELTQALYSLSEISSPAPIGFLEALKQTHPDIKDRIERLESYTQKI